MKTEKFISLSKENLSDKLLETFDFQNYLQNRDEIESFEEFEQILQDNNAFDIEVIYYSEAIKYLMENDPSLQESLEIANEFGYSVENLNSEILASLHSSREARNLFYEEQDTIQGFFEDNEDDEE